MVKFEELITGQLCAATKFDVDTCQISLTANSDSASWHLEKKNLGDTSVAQPEPLHT